MRALRGVVPDGPVPQRALLRLLVLVVGAWGAPWAGSGLKLEGAREVGLESKGLLGRYIHDLVGGWS